MGIEQFRGGSQAARDKLNQLIGEVNPLSSIIGDNRFITVARGRGGSRVSLNISAVRAHMPTAHLVPDGLIVVGNNSGHDYDRFNVMGIEDILISPSSDLDEFKNQTALQVTDPNKTDHTGLFVVTYDRIPSNGVGRAFISNWCVCRVNMLNALDDTADVADSKGVVSIKVTNGGSNYTSTPSVGFSGGSGTGAAATASVSNGKVTSITITDPGKDYTGAPTVAFSGGGGSSAAATAYIGGAFLESRSTTGSAEILWVDSGTGVKWAVVRLGNGPKQVGFFKLVATVTKPGMYTAHPLQFASSQPSHSNSSALADADFGAADTANTVYLINEREEGLSGHALSASTVPNKYVGYFRGYEADGTPIYAINECQ